MTSTTYRYRLIAKITIEAETPLAVGSGESSLVTDSKLATDINGLPYIPGTAVAGVLRHLIGEDAAALFGGQNAGSRIIFSEARLNGSGGRPADGLKTELDDFLRNYRYLPIRQHVRISDKGTAEDTGKFDEEVVWKGSRFCFEVELLSTKDNTIEEFKNVLSKLNSPAFRIGGGTTCGFGKIKVVSCKTRSLDLKSQQDRDFYSHKSSSLSEDWDGEMMEIISDKDKVISYKLELQPEDFFLFGSGQGDNDADMTAVKEKVVKWDPSGNPHLSEKEEEKILIPATSVKGAISHRVAYHYNKLHDLFAEDGNAKSGEDNIAVQTLFGYADKDGQSRKGCIYLSDVFIDGTSDKVIPHTAIDRFTGGTIDGALFSEKTTYGNGKNIMLDIVYYAGGQSEQELAENDARTALEEALKDICKGLLPLGGGVNRGNGAFKGSLIRNRETIYGD